MRMKTTVVAYTDTDRQLLELHKGLRALNLKPYCVPVVESKNEQPEVVSPAPRELNGYQPRSPRHKRRTPQKWSGGRHVDLVWEEFLRCEKEGIPCTVELVKERFRKECIEDNSVSARIADCGLYLTVSGGVISRTELGKRITKIPSPLMKPPHREYGDIHA